MILSGGFPRDSDLAHIAFGICVEASVTQKLLHVAGLQNQHQVDAAAAAR